MTSCWFAICLFLKDPFPGLSRGLTGKGRVNGCRRGAGGGGGGGGEEGQRKESNESEGGIGNVWAVRTAGREEIENGCRGPEEIKG